MGVQPGNNDNLTPEMIEMLARDGRTRKILVKLCKHFDDITENDKLKLVIDCAGPHVRLTRTLHDDN